MQSKIDIVRLLMLLFLSVMLSPWFHTYSQAYMAADTFWLAEAASRFISGESMAAAYYDPNPPLSVLLYVPAALISEWGILPIHMSAFYFTLIILAFTSLLLFKTLKAVPDSDKLTPLLCTSTFIIANTVLTAITFTERDQILGMALCVFVVTQVFITKKWPMPHWLFHVTLLLGAILVLLKPHHGLLPTLIILHRAITQRRISIWKDADFIYLASCVSGYLLLCLTYFSDYSFQILPDVLSLYSKTATPFIVLHYAHYVLVFIGILIAGYLINGKKTSWPGTFFLACAVVAFIPYIAQMRGYHYHMLPAVMFFTIGLACTIRDIVSRFINPHYSALLALIAITAAALLHYPLMRNFPTHEEYKNDMPLSQVLQRCPDPCSFLMINDSMEIAHQMAAYHGLTWASRFPSLWFMPAVISLLGDEKVEQADALRDKYGQMISEDLARYKPQLVILGEFYVTQNGKFNFAKFFAVNSDFRTEWARYRLSERITIDQGVYFRGTVQGKYRPMTYQVYERIE